MHQPLLMLPMQNPNRVVQSRWFLGALPLHFVFAVFAAALQNTPLVLKSHTCHAMDALQSIYCWSWKLTAGVC